MLVIGTIDRNQSRSVMEADLLPLVRDDICLHCQKQIG